MNYKRIDVEDIDVLKKYLPVCKICDYTLGTLYMWKDYYKFCYCIEDDTLFVKGESISHEKTAFFPPIHSANMRESVKKVVAYCKENAIEPFFSPVCKPLMEMFGDDVEIEKLDDWSDYLYDAEQFCTLSGKKLHGKRNHINKFKSLYDWKFLPFDGKDVDKVKAFLKEYDDGTFPPMQEYENNTTINILDLWDKFDFFGGMLLVGGKIIGISIGEYSGDTLVVHTEKALRDFEGSYEMLAHCFANEYRGDKKYINREEDLGDEGLRKAKQSYQPVEMLDKFNVVVKNIM